MTQRTVAEALVALASQDQLGEVVDWGDICAGISALLTDPVGARDLRAVMKRLNNPDVATTLQDWFLRRAQELRASGQKAERGADRLLKPLERASAGVGAAALLGLGTGAIATGLALPLVLAGVGVGVSSALGGWHLIGQRDTALAEAEAIDRIAAVCHPPTG